MNNLHDIKRQAIALMTIAGVGHLNFDFDRGTRRIAATHFRTLPSATGRVTLPHKITISKRWALVLPDHDLREVLIHEIAHAVLPYTKGCSHGADFQSVVRQMGGTAVRPRFRPSVNIDGSPRY